MIAPKKHLPAGRPPKYDEPSRPVTVTLPHRILDQLGKVDLDRGKAIVKCVEVVAQNVLDGKSRIELIKAFDNASLIVIGPCPSLAAIPWLRLAEIAPARFLLSIPSGTSPALLEIAILDLIEHLSPERAEDKGMLEELRHILSRYRRQDEMAKGEILFIMAEWLLMLTPACLLRFLLMDFDFSRDYPLFV